MNIIPRDLNPIIFILLNPLSQIRIPKGLSVTQLVTIPADLAAFVEVAASISPISVIFLRFTTGQEIAEFIDDSNDLQHLRRDVSRGSFETLVTVCSSYYQRVIGGVKGILREVVSRCVRRGTDLPRAFREG